MGLAADIGEIGYKGYILYDEVEIELSKKYFGTNFKDDELGTDGYAYAYLLNQKGIDKDNIQDHYALRKDELDVEIKAAFERDVRSSKLDIVTTDGIRVLEVSEFNRDFTISYEQILKERSKVKGTNSGDDTNLNAVFAEHNGSRTMFIEGTNAEEDSDLLRGDWFANFNMGVNVSKDVGSTPKIYLDAYNYYQKYGDGSKIVVGNSQGGGSSIYIGLQDPSIQVVALSPAPQYIGDIDPNGNYSNITVIYNSTDVLYNITKGAGFTTDIPGANIVHVEYGLNKFINLGSGSMVELLIRDIHAGHTGDVSAVDYDGNGKLSELEKGLGIDIDDVVPRSVFTGSIIGSNTSGGEQLVMSKEHMQSFASHLDSILRDDIEPMIERNKKAKTNNYNKTSMQKNKIKKISIDVSMKLVNFSTDYLKPVFKIEGSIASLDTKSFSADLLEEVSLLNSVINLSLTSVYMNAVSNLNTLSEDLAIISESLESKRGINLSLSKIARGKLLQAVVEVVKGIMSSISRIDYVGHDGKYAIYDTVDSVLKSLGTELNNLKMETRNLEKVTSYVANVFDSNDKEISKKINDGVSVGNLSEDEELILSDQEKYKKSLHILRRMNVIEQFERLVEDGILELRPLISEMVVAAIDMLDLVIMYKEDILTLLDYVPVKSELEAQMALLDTQIIAIQSMPYNTALAPLVGQYKAQKNLLNIISTKFDKFITGVETVSDVLGEYLNVADSALREIPNVDQIIVAYVEPRIESMLYDVSDMAVVRDSIKLNSQVLQRMQTEINQAMDTLNGNVSFMGKDGLNELVRELNLRTTALSTLHKDVFGDV